MTNTNDIVNDLFDSVFGGPYKADGMRTDIYSKDDMYNMEIDVAGYKKEELSISLYNGTLTVKAEHKESQEDKGQLLHQERYRGVLSRSWKVSDALNENDIKASYADGVLTLSFPSDKKKEQNEKKFISIL